jgi:hypothetical protein
MKKLKQINKKKTAVNKSLLFNNSTFILLILYFT